MKLYEQLKMKDVGDVLCTIRAEQYGLPGCNNSALFANSKLSSSGPKMYCID